MGTNYYRIPTELEMEERRDRLRVRLIGLKMTPDLIADRFRYIDAGLDDEVFGGITPWDEFIEGTNIHLGKRSMGWKFCWNFHDNKYYSNKQQLIDFVKSGRVVDEYGSEEEPQAFLDMAFNWGEPDGLVADKEYFDTTNHHHWMSNPEDYYDREVDGLRVCSSTEFS